MLTLLRHYMTLLFWFRKNTRARERPGTIQCRVTVDKAEYNFSTGVYVQKDDWDAPRQVVRGRTDEVKVANQRLTQLDTGLREAFNILEREGAYMRALVGPGPPRYVAGGRRKLAGS